MADGGGIREDEEKGEEGTASKNNSKGGLV
jgi:hypothetical protein